MKKIGIIAAAVLLTVGGALGATSAPVSQSEAITAYIGPYKCISVQPLGWTSSYRVCNWSNQVVSKWYPYGTVIWY